MILSQKGGIRVLSLIAMSLFCCLGIAPAQAAAAPISQGYSAKETIADGSLVSLITGEAATIATASVDRRDALLGISISPSKSLIAYGDNENKVQVVTEGTASLLVSTANGEIHTGDSLTISPISGVAMRASTAGKVVGIAQQDFTSQDDSSKQKVEISDSKGGKQTVQVGRIDADIKVQDWYPPNEQNSPVMNGLRGFLANIVGKPVSNTQALLAIGVVVLALLASGIILYSSISSSIYSIGRNPLSKGIIRRSLFIMIGLAIIVVIGAGSAVFLILGG